MKKSINVWEKIDFKLWKLSMCKLDFPIHQRLMWEIEEPVAVILYPLRDVKNET